MAARRYWRVSLFGPGAFGAIGIAGMEMRETAGGANVATGGTPSVSSVTSGSAANVFDGNASTYWNAGGNPVWVKYDFGAGVTRDIRELVLTPNNASQNGANQAPQWIRAESSPDDSTYTDEWISLCTIPWTIGGAQTFTRPSIGTGTARYWGVAVMTANGGFVSAAEFALRNGAGPNLLLGATASASNAAGGAASQANDGITTSGGWQSTAGAGMAWWRADLGAGNGITMPQYFEMTPSGSTFEAPLDFYVVRSATAGGMEIVGQYRAGPRSAYVTQQFALPQPAGAARRRVMIL